MDSAQTLESLVRFQSIIIIISLSFLAAKQTTRSQGKTSEFRKTEKSELTSLLCSIRVVSDLERKFEKFANEMMIDRHVSSQYIHDNKQEISFTFLFLFSIKKNTFTFRRVYQL